MAQAPAGKHRPDTGKPTRSGFKASRFKVYAFCSLRAPPQQHAWEYSFRKVQAQNSPNCVLPRVVGCCSTRGSMLFASFKPQTPESCTPARGGPLPSSTRGSTPFASFRPKTLRIVYSPAWWAAAARFSQVPSPKLRIVHSPAWRAPPQQHAWEYAVRKFQAPNSRIVYSPAWRAPPQQHAWEYSFRKLQAQTLRIVYSPPRGSALPGSTRESSGPFPRVPDMCCSQRFCATSLKRPPPPRQPPSCRRKLGAIARRARGLPSGAWCVLRESSAPCPQPSTGPGYFPPRPAAARPLPETFTSLFCSCTRSLQRAWNVF